MSEQPEVRKIAGYMPVSLDMAFDLGLMTETEARAQGWTPYVAPPISIKRRFRLWLMSRWARRPRTHLGPCDHDDCGGW